MCYKSAYHPHWGKHHHRHHRHHAKKRYWKNKFTAWAYPPVNVEEEDEQYLIRLYAAGYQKDDFQVAVEDDILVIKVQKEEQPQQDFHKRWAFVPGNFERHFELNDKINKESINAKYEEGVLTITLPKLEGKETFRQDIDIV